jgi:hypothetical protein
LEIIEISVAFSLIRKGMLSAKMKTVEQGTCLCLYKGSVALVVDLLRGSHSYRGTFCPYAVIAAYKGVCGFLIGIGLSVIVRRVKGMRI